MRTALRNSIICVLAASMAGILTACHITKATIDTIIRFFSRTSPDSNSALNRDDRTHLERFARRTAS